MNIQKSSGVTRTEQLLSELCDRTFLKLWTYPNPYKDDGHELCDLLVVFENHVIIFFDRESRRLQECGEDISLGWQRWKKEVVDKQIKTANGAERYLRSGRPIFLDAKKEKKFPLQVEADNVRVHKIVVAHGAEEACKNFSDMNINGSLAVMYGEHDESPLPDLPFCVPLDKKQKIHLFDSFNLPLLLSELDTVYDFTAYLSSKEEAIQKYDLLNYCGEEDLLAHYLLNLDDLQNHYIGTKKSDINVISIGEGEWKDFSKTDNYKHSKALNQISYRVWDSLLQYTCQNALSGVLLGNADVYNGESALREMAKEPRFYRRELSIRIHNAIHSFPDDLGPLARKVTLCNSYFADKAYVFLQLKVDDIHDYEGEYREKRRAMLELACGAAKNKFPSLKKVVGIAIDAPKFAKGNSEDFILMNCEEWTNEMRDHYEDGNKLMGFFKTGQLQKNRVFEFPNIPKTNKRSKIGRNELCTCGSGIKYKKCHGKS